MDWIGDAFPFAKAYYSNVEMPGDGLSHPAPR